jgi:hypothetical protein
MNVMLDAVEGIQNKFWPAFRTNWNHDNKSDGLSHNHC